LGVKYLTEAIVKRAQRESPLSRDECNQLAGIAARLKEALEGVTLVKGWEERDFDHATPSEELYRAVDAIDRLLAPEVEKIALAEAAAIPARSHEDVLAALGPAGLEEGIDVRFSAALLQLQHPEEIRGIIGYFEARGHNPSQLTDWLDYSLRLCRGPSDAATALWRDAISAYAERWIAAESKVSSVKMAKLAADLANASVETLFDDAGSPVIVVPAGESRGTATDLESLAADLEKRALATGKPHAASRGYAGWYVAFPDDAPGTCRERRYFGITLEIPDLLQVLSAVKEFLGMAGPKFGRRFTETAGLREFLFQVGTTNLDALRDGVQMLKSGTTYEVQTLAQMAARAGVRFDQSTLADALPKSG
jgi:hypothetical protein